MSPTVWWALAPAIGTFLPSRSSRPKTGRATDAARRPDTAQLPPLLVRPSPKNTFRKFANAIPVNERAFCHNRPAGR